MFTLKIHCFPVLCCIMLFWEYHSASFCSYRMGCNVFSAPPPSTLLLFQSPGLPINILILKCLCTPLRNTQLAARVFWLQDTPRPKSQLVARRHRRCRSQRVEASSALLGKLPALSLLLLPSFFHESEQMRLILLIFLSSLVFLFSDNYQWKHFQIIHNHHLTPLSIFTINVVQL